MTLIAMSRAEIDRMSALQDLTANRQVTDAATLVSAGVTCFGEYLLPEAFGITATRPARSGRSHGWHRRRFAQSRRLFSRQ